ncbi:hypothetical protein [Nocardia vaccinii]|uniref:hypothetical protein n=1 Tax=Nocardia vaccinii TaxID=1822 RepID=UPI000832AAAF|nr:hypothetical protein [Nocardia vaccinii]
MTLFRNISSIVSPSPAGRATGIAMAVATIGFIGGCGHGAHSATPAEGPAPALAAVEAEAGPPATADPAEYHTDYGTTFKSPSGRFLCGIDAGRASCNGRFPPGTPTVSDCTGRQLKPNTISVSTGTRASFGNACSPVAGPDSKVLPYDVALRVAGTQCVVHEATGVTCRTGDGHGHGHGFTISDAAYRLD